MRLPQTLPLLLLLLLIPALCVAVPTAQKTSSLHATQYQHQETTPRIVAYVNCVCGFGFASDGDSVCGNDPGSGTNHVLAWETAKNFSVTHYVLSFASFTDTMIQSDAGSIWANGGGSTTDFNLNTNLKAALSVAQQNGKTILLSIGGETGSLNFLRYWNNAGQTTQARVKYMNQDISRVVSLFQSQNGISVNGIDIDIELSGAYTPASDKYNSTRDLINAVPEDLLVSFVPQVGNGLCAAPSVGDALTPVDALGGQCQQNAKTGDPWDLTQLDEDCLDSTGRPRLAFFGIQYYNAASALCCGGGTSSEEITKSVVQNYKNLALGWDEVTFDEMSNSSSPWYPYRWYPGPWAGFNGTSPSRLVLGKPGCSGCAGSDFQNLDDVTDLLSSLHSSLRNSTRPLAKEAFGGVLFWDLCRLFGSTGPFCVGSHCQPSWGSGGVLEGLAALAESVAQV